MGSRKNHAKRMNATKARRERREQFAATATKTQEEFDYSKVNWQEWEDAGFYTPINPDVVYIPVGVDYFEEFGGSLPPEIQLLVEVLREAFDDEFEDYSDAEIVSGGMSFVKAFSGAPVGLTALTVFFNWKMWECYGKDMRFAKIYSDLYEYAKRMSHETLKSDDLAYYYRVTD